MSQDYLSSSRSLVGFHPIHKMVECRHEHSPPCSHQRYREYPMAGQDAENAYMLQLTDDARFTKPVVQTVLIVRRRVFHSLPTRTKDYLHT